MRRSASRRRSPRRARVRRRASVRRAWGGRGRDARDHGRRQRGGEAELGPGAGARPHHAYGRYRHRPGDEAGQPGALLTNYASSPKACGWRRPMASMPPRFRGGARHRAPIPAERDLAAHDRRGFRAARFCPAGAEGPGNAAGSGTGAASRDADGGQAPTMFRLLVATGKSELDAIAVVTLYPKQGP